MNCETFTLTNNTTPMLHRNKKCSGCLEYKDVTEFHKHYGNKDGLSYKCKVCRSKQNKDYYLTFNGMVSDIYNTQLYNCKKRGHKPPEYSKEELSNWLIAQPKFEELNSNWIGSGYKKDLKPSIDRIDDYKTYSFNNIRLVTWRDNNLKGNYDRRNGVNNKVNKAVNKYDINNNLIKEYHSIREASRDSGVNRQGINFCCNGKYSQAGGYIWKFKIEQNV